MPADQRLAARPALAALLQARRREAPSWHADPLLRWMCWVAGGLLLMFAAGYGLDHPLARYVHTHPGFPRNARRVVHIPEMVVAAAVATVVALGAYGGFVGRVRGVWRDVLLASVSLCIALTLTSVLKVWFGRIPPARWYSAQWHNFFAYLDGSFPSGHMTAMSSVAPFLWHRSRWLMLLLVLAGLAACYGLVTQQAHFASDLIGGTLVGGSVGYAVRLGSEHG